MLAKSEHADQAHGSEAKERLVLMLEGLMLKCKGYAHSHSLFSLQTLQKYSLFKLYNNELLIEKVALITDSAR